MKTLSALFLAAALSSLAACGVEETDKWAACEPEALVGQSVEELAARCGEPLRVSPCERDSCAPTEERWVYREAWAEFRDAPPFMCAAVLNGVVTEVLMLRGECDLGPRPAGY